MVWFHNRRRKSSGQDGEERERERLTHIQRGVAIAWGRKRPGVLLAFFPG